MSSPEDSSVSWKHISGQNDAGSPGERIYSDQSNDANAASLLEVWNITCFINMCSVSAFEIVFDVL